MRGKYRNYRDLFPLKLEEIQRLVGNLREDRKGCWLWKSEGYNTWYAKVGMRRSVWLVHRLMYELFVGHVKEGYVVDHLCRRPGCCNPSHLEAVTNSENTLRGPRPRGTRHHFGAKTHCKEGHPYSGDNLILQTWKGGVRRICRECRKKWNRLCMRKRRAAAKAAREAARAGGAAHDPAPAQRHERAK